MSSGDLTGTTTTGRMGPHQRAQAELTALLSTGRHSWPSTTPSNRHLPDGTAGLLIAMGEADGTQQCFSEPCSTHPTSLSEGQAPDKLFLSPSLSRDQRHPVTLQQGMAARPSSTFSIF